MSDYLSPNFHDRSFLFDIKRTGVDFDIYTTTEDYGTVYNWVATFMGLKYFRIAAGTNDIKIQINGSLDGYHWDETDIVYPESVIKAGDTLVLDLARYLPLIQIVAKDSIAGNHGTVTCELVATSHDIQNRGLYAIGYEQIDVTASSVVELNDQLRVSANHVLVTVESNPVRARWDGGLPTTTLGHIFRIGDIIQITSVDDMSAFRAISTGGASQLNVTYSR